VLSVNEILQADIKVYHGNGEKPSKEKTILLLSGHYAKKKITRHFYENCHYKNKNSVAVSVAFIPVGCVWWQKNW
jgi:hypothetical protein